MSVLHCGIARGHHGNPTAGLRVEKIYGAPVLLSGVAALVLKTPELAALNAHYRKSVRQLLRLPINTLGLLGMIGRLTLTNILNRIGRHALMTAANLHSWFIQVRHISAQYQLPDPLLVLQLPPSGGSPNSAEWS